jgi:tRNA(fMet)-specific endonuclease VapC
VDSNAVIAYWSGDARACAIIDGATTLFLPAIVLEELMYGACNSVRQTANERTVLLFADHCSVLPVDGAVAEQYARIRVSLKKKGKPRRQKTIFGYLRFAPTMASR